MKLTAIKKNPDNPRVLKDDKFKKLVKSIQDFPQMMELRPIVVDENGVILGGNMRYEALKSIGKKEIPDTWVKRADELTEEQKREFIIKDNVGFGEWDWDILANEWDADLLDDWGLELNFTDNDVKNESNNKLIDKFLIPPFSVLDTRQGYWQERKKAWKGLINDNGESRKETLGSGGLTIDANSNSWLHNPKLGGGVSLLDPVLSELVNLWFGITNGNTFDCFAGDSVFGFVSGYMGNNFTGIEIRKEQADINKERTKKFNCNYICDDGQNVLKHIKENSQDLLFSCPPYFDLEVYSDLKNDASNQKEYSKFIKIIENAFVDSIKCLKNNRFAVITVGDIRDKNGKYRLFVDDIKSIFTNNGMCLYNELILVEPIAFGAIRAGGNMISRKITKCHQNVLVFYKGDTKEIKNIFPKIEVNCESTDFQQVDVD